MREERTEEVGETRKRKLGLALDRPRREQSQLVSALGRVPEERRLAGPDLASEDEDAATPRARSLDQSVYPAAFGVTSDEHPSIVFRDRGRSPIRQRGSPDAVEPGASYRRCDDHGGTR